MISGVYKIQSKIKPDRIYVGSAVDINARWRTHKCSLRKDNHYSRKLQRHYNKYGEDDLVFSILTVCEKKELYPINGIIRPEQFFIWAYNPYFNTCQFAGSCMGVKVSDDARRKMSLSHKGKKKTEEHIRKINESRKRNGRINGDRDMVAFCRELAKKNKGTKRSDESKKKLSDGLKKHWKEHPRKPIPIEERKKHGRPISEERKEQIRQWWKVQKELGNIRKKDDKGRFISNNNIIDDK